MRPADEFQIRPGQTVRASNSRLLQFLHFFPFCPFFMLIISSDS